MKHSTFLLLTGLLLTACVSTQIDRSPGVRLHVPAGAVVLFDRIPGLNDHQSDGFYQTFQSKIGECCVPLFVPHLDYEFKAVGLDPTKLRTDSLTLLRAGKAVQSDFALFVTITGAGTIWDRDMAMTPYQRDFYSPTRQGQTHFELVSLTNPKYRWSYSVETQIKSYIHEGSAVTLAANFANEEGAIRKSFQKGVSELNASAMNDCDRVAGLGVEVRLR